ncbi:hypothetical protein DFP98_10261 [Cohnella phaseoli]|uniref:Uncharacterized protein n=1 Tax=Cohnella phaseoli TaxID=456490 RepID=A0A3D9KPT0_9BACL|nr:hypothetical protein DFP98_10261 [Cohnella phaseoli]
MAHLVATLFSCVSSPLNSSVPTTHPTVLIVTGGSNLPFVPLPVSSLALACAVALAVGSFVGELVPSLPEDEHAVTSESSRVVAMAIEIDCFLSFILLPLPCCGWYSLILAPEIGSPKYKIEDKSITIQSDLRIYRYG